MPIPVDIGLRGSAVLSMPAPAAAAAGRTPP